MFPVTYGETHIESCHHLSIPLLVRSLFKDLEIDFRNKMTQYHGTTYIDTATGYTVYFNAIKGYMYINYTAVYTNKQYKINRQILNMYHN